MWTLWDEMTCQISCAMRQWTRKQQWTRRIRQTNESRSRRPSTVVPGQRSVLHAHLGRLQTEPSIPGQAKWRRYSNTGKAICAAFHCKARQASLWGKRTQESKCQSKRGTQSSGGINQRLIIQPADSKQQKSMSPNELLIWKKSEQNNRKKLEFKKKI